MLEIKPGVTLLGLVPQMTLAVTALECLFRELGTVCVITAGNDGSHSETSEHYAGRALDFRTRTLTPSDARKLVERASSALGRDYLVLLESDHIHVHYRPKKPTAEAQA